MSLISLKVDIKIHNNKILFAKIKPSLDRQIKTDKNFQIPQKAFKFVKK